MPVKALSAPNTEKKVFTAVDPSLSSAANAEGIAFEAYEFA